VDDSNTKKSNINKLMTWQHFINRIKKAIRKKNHHDGTNELKWQWSTPKKILQSEANKRSQCNAKKNLNQPSVNH